jgi:hypothetical protein
LAPLPGLGSLAAAARRSDDPARLVGHCQALPGGLPVVIAPADAEQARAALAMLTGQGAELLLAVAADPNVVVLLDAGRIEPGSPVLALLRGASAVLMLARPQVADLAHVAGVLTVIPTWTRCAGLVLVGGGYSSAEIKQELGVPVMATLPEDPRGADVLCGRPGGRGVHRSALGQAAARLAGQILTRLHDPDSGHSGVPPRRRAGEAAAVARQAVRRHRRTDVADTGAAEAEAR